MALRASARVLREAAGKSGGSVPGGGLLQDIRKRISTQKFLRPDVEDDILRQPVDQAKYRFPSPGSQPHPVVPQGSYDQVYNITYHNRDKRRQHVYSSIDPATVEVGDIPPTPGKVVKVTFLGMAGDYDIHQ